ncbi:hypothetical protein Pan44_05490 [Caulifigura coniformis]|uniref:Uncharacterized protein n=1 Tax=Caulifigura coniformis TaxID=2527983 RepID=A0A517S8S6_9PLAN|nr:hypothetical protein [Caulifigura coniformis]QDT52537.1 hypothetical protein Pan44_05490 [Caulifigura coniformis]
MFHIHILFAALFLLLASQRSFAQEAADTRLVKEVVELMAARAKAVSSIHIIADHLSLSSSSAAPLTLEEFRRTFFQYAATSGMERDRATLYRSLLRQGDPARGVRSVEFYRDGPRTAEFSKTDNFVTDERATVWFVSSEGRIQANIWEPHRSTIASLGLSTFSHELGIKSPETAFKVVMHAATDDTGHIVLKWREDTTDVVYEFSREDGIMRSMQASSPGFETLTIQAGRYVSPEGIPFPLVSGRLSFRDGGVRSVQVVAPRLVEVNRPVSPETFRVAAERGSVIVDEREKRRVSAAGQTEDIVGLANSAREADKAKAAGLRVQE